MQANPAPQSLSTHLDYIDGTLCFDGVPLDDLAEQFGTPLYVYSASQLKDSFDSYATACGELAALQVCYAVKANSNIHLLKLLGSWGAHFDIVSSGELARVIAAGVTADRAVFAGVGKSKGEIEFALNQGVGCFNVESFQEMERIAQTAEKLGKIASVSVRVNPDVDAKTHKYISTGLKENKFGISMEEAPAVYRFAHESPWLQVHGIDCHIGSQITTESPYLDALERVLALVDLLAEQGIEVGHLDLGGGIGIRYRDETPPKPQDVLGKMAAGVSEWSAKRGKPMPTLSVEPGRSIVGNAGILLTTVEYLKSNQDKHFAIIDAAMNDLMRPSLYGAYHAVVSVREESQAQELEYDLVGPICESGDFLAKGRALKLEQGDLLAVLSAGAYGQTMASNYNTRGRAAEVLVEQGRIVRIRRRETLEDQLRTELEA